MVTVSKTTVPSTAMPSIVNIFSSLLMVVTHEILTMIYPSYSRRHLIGKTVSGGGIGDTVVGLDAKGILDQ